MRRRTQLILVAGGATATIAGGAFALRRLAARTPPGSPAEESLFTVYAPGGRYGFMANGPVGRVISKIMPILEAGVYEVAAEMLDLQPEDELLDIGCGPGAFLATKAQHARRVVGLDPSRVMLHEAESRLADRLAAGTARLVIGSAAALPFSDGEFSATTAIFAPSNPAEAFRVLRPGGRFVIADNDPRKSPSEPTSRWGRLRWTEAELRRMAEDAGFTELTARYKGDYLLLSGRKPAGSRPNPKRGVTPPEP
ncbi:MAG: methyltransferase domain-containing protein [Chloroflexi bacterium]|nr:methyltransferase domain-containing protein [Chloroflexota bacterium]